MEAWYRRARKFILNQRKTELERSIQRFPNSERYSSRQNELIEIEEELKQLETE